MTYRVLCSTSNHCERKLCHVWKEKKPTICRLRFRICPGARWYHSQHYDRGREIWIWDSLCNRTSPNDAGVRLVGTKKYHYNAATPEYLAEVEAAKVKRTNDVAHCKKLLIDLPIALENSKDAMTQLKKSESVDLSELGAMMLEQDRISQEIELREDEFLELHAPAPSIRLSDFMPHVRQHSVVLQFGRNRIGEEIFNVMHKVHTPKVELIDPSTSLVDPLPASPASASSSSSSASPPGGVVAPAAPTSLDE
jgi:hypothetical protein